MPESVASPAVARGLEGIVIATTSMSRVYGQEGRLIYRGYDIADLADQATFEEVAYLLWNGDLPSVQQLADFKELLTANRELPDEVVALLASMPKGTVPMVALRTAASMLGAFDADAELADEDAVRRCATRLVAKLPTIVAAFQRLRSGADPLAPRDDLDHAANFLYMMRGVPPSETARRAVDAYLVLLADHGFNASTFSARVTASTMADIYSAVTAALGTLKGRLHGGANQRVMETLETVGGPDKARDWVLEAVGRHERIMGIGHRVYKTRDPRAKVLRRMSEELAKETDPGLHETALTIADTAVSYFEEHRPDLKLYPNVDFYSAVVLHAAGIPTDQFTPLFAMSRIAGWTAHVMEQYADNRLIRPRAEYVGPTDRHWVPIEER